MACNLMTASLSTLPSELLYRILDLLDTDTILLSFGIVCRRFRSIIQTYNHYEINFQSISKPYFHSICRLILPENIISLTLSNDNQTPDQIKLFLSLFPVERLVRLSSLTLLQIDEDDFQTVFQSDNSVRSLTFTFRKKKALPHPETLSILSSIISSQSLRHLDFALLPNTIDHLVWSHPCFLHSLTIMNSLEFKQFSMILTHAALLKKLTISDCYIEDLECSMTYPQLLSLTLDDSELDMNGCQCLLSLTPSLEHLHIVGGTDLSDGASWEQFIEMKLLKLKQFQFAFCGRTQYILESSSEMEVLLAPFRTAFWLEKKRWFVVCYYFKKSTNFSLYSLPICKSNVRFYPSREKISSSTSPTVHTDETLVDQVHEMQLNLTNLISNRDDDENVSTTYPFFRKLSKLALSIDHQWPVGSVEHLSTFMNLSLLVELTISIDFDSESVSNKLTHITDLLQQTCHLHTLTIDSLSISAENICLLVPSHVKHLQVSAKEMDDLKLIVERLRHLSSVTFEVIHDLKCLFADFVKWLMEKRNNSTCRYDNILLSIWFDRMKSRVH